MSVPQSVSDVLRHHVTREVECIDRIYLNVYQAKLQTPAQAAAFFKYHRGRPDEVDLGGPEVSASCPASITGMPQRSRRMDRQGAGGDRKASTEG